MRCRRFSSARPAALPGRLIWEKYPVKPRVRFPHEILSGIDDPLPPIKGFVLTDKKENPLVETLLTSPEPAGEKNNTMLASLDLRAGQGRGLHQRRRRTLDRRLGQQRIVRQALRPDGPLVDAAGGRDRASSPSPPTWPTARSAWWSMPWTKTTSSSTSST